MAAYYNEIDPYAAQWLRNLIKEGLIADGDVDTRSIADVHPVDLLGYDQCHFFAGIGGWSYALRLAGWPDDRPVWTGSCPCQPFSLAGKQGGFDDDRHLWPQFKRLIAERSPATVFGEQVASATKWLGLVRSDLEAMGYAVGAMPIQAASAGAYHLRDRYWFVADDGGRRRLGPGEGQGEQSRRAEAVGAGDIIMADASGITERKPTDQDDTFAIGGQARAESCKHSWVIGADGKARRVKSGIRLLAHGVPARVGKLRGFGNAIDPRPASEFIRAFMSSM